MGSADSLRTGAETFFAQSAIVREEALFQGIDRLLAGRAVPAPVKRSGVRRFSAGRINAADLGPARVWQKGDHILLSTNKNAAGERGFALLIKAPGLYTLKRVTVEVQPCRGNAAESGGGFFALLPLAVRPCFKGDCILNPGGKIKAPGAAEGRRRVLSAIDARGVAAFIGPGKALRRREMPLGAARDGADSERFWVITVLNNNTGGMDVQQSK
jgi:hypothetical protein